MSQQLVREIPVYLAQIITEIEEYLWLCIPRKPHFHYHCGAKTFLYTNILRQRQGFFVFDSFHTYMWKECVCLPVDVTCNIRAWGQLVFPGWHIRIHYHPCPRVCDERWKPLMFLSLMCLMCLECALITKEQNDVYVCVFVSPERPGYWGVWAMKWTVEFSLMSLWQGQGVVWCACSRLSLFFLPRMTPSHPTLSPASTGKHILFLCCHSFVCLFVYSSSEQVRIRE